MAVRNANILAARGLLFLFNFYSYQLLTQCSCCRCDQNGIFLLSPRRNI